MVEKQIKVNHFSNLESALQSMEAYSFGVVHENYLNIEFPSFYIFKGEVTSKTLWIQAGLHGDEYDGIYSCLDIMKELDIFKLKGTIIICPVVNTSAFENRSNATAIDGINLNRVFSDGAEESFSLRYGHWLAQKVIAFADVFIDLHGGGKYLDVAPFAMISNKMKSELYQKLLRQLDVDYIYQVSGKHKSMLVQFLGENDVPGILLESGGGMHQTHESVERHKKNIYSLMSLLNMYTRNRSALPSIEKSREIVNMTKVRDIFFSMEGLVVHRKQVGESISNGDLLFEVMDIRQFTTGKMYYSGEHGVVLSINSSSFVKQNDYAAMIGEI